MPPRMHVVIALLLVLSAACTREHRVSTLPAGKRVQVRTTDQLVWSASVAEHPTKIVLVDDAGRTIDPNRIVRISKNNHARGALDGALGGGIAGLLIGGTLGLAASSDCGPNCLLSSWETAAIAGATLGLGGALGGALIGAMIGSTDVYTFGGHHEIRVLPSGPPGSVAGATIKF